MSKMANTDESKLDNVIRLTRISEIKFQQGDFKGAIEGKREVKSILNSKFVDEEIIEKYKEELSNLYFSKFDLIYDHKLRINEIKKNKLIKLLEEKSDQKYKSGDYKGAIKALRRSEKYFSN